MTNIAEKQHQHGDTDIVSSAVRTLGFEVDGLKTLSAAIRGELAEPFVQAVEVIRRASGRVIVTGIGKSGHIGQKIAATLASTGTSSFFVHASEASHGDLGMIQPDDVVLALSWSGETAELTSIINFSRRFKVPLIALTSRSESALAQASEVVLLLPTAEEACPHGLTPTTSTAMQLAMGDCLAVALLESKGFTALDFKVFHPGGQLGANLKFVADIMHKAERLPLTNMHDSMSEALVTMTEKSFGCLGVTDDNGRLIGIITDGDLRRHMGQNLLSATAEQIMTPHPKTVSPEMLVSAALELVNASSITAVFAVVDEKPVGIIHIHDLLRIGIA